MMPMQESKMPVAVKTYTCEDLAEMESITNTLITLGVPYSVMYNGDCAWHFRMTFIADEAPPMPSTVSPYRDRP